MSLSINLIIVGILILVGIIALKLNHLKHRVLIILLILFALFLYSSAAFITGSEEVDLTSSKGVFSASRIYMGWLANGFQNFKTITADAINMDWLSTNGTFKNNNIDDDKNSLSKSNKIAKTSRLNR